MLFLSIFVLKEGRGTDGEDYYISLHTMKRNVLENFLKLSNLPGTINDKIYQFQFSGLND